MSLCGQSPLFVPTTVNAQIKNIDAVDVAATSVSCTNLTVNGVNWGNVLQNVASTSSGNTTFTGTLGCTSLAATASVTANDATIGTVNSTALYTGTVDSSLTSAGVLSSTSVTNSGAMTTGSFTSNAAATVGGNFTNNGTATFGSTFLVKGTSTFKTDAATVPALYITPFSNRVGINTSNPGVPLEVQSTSTGTVLPVVNILASTNTTTGNKTMLRLGNSTSTRGCTELAFAPDSTTNGNNKLVVSFNDTAGTGDCMSVNALGEAVIKSKLAINKTSASSALDVTGTVTTDTLTVNGNITQSAGTAALKVTTLDGNMTQSAGTATLKATTVDSLTTTGNITYQSNPIYPIVKTSVITLASDQANIDVFASDLPSWVTRITLLVYNWQLSAAGIAGFVPKANGYYGNEYGSGVRISDAISGSAFDATSGSDASTLAMMWNTSSYTGGNFSRTRYEINKVEDGLWLYQTSSGSQSNTAHGMGYFAIRSSSTTTVGATSGTSMTVTVAGWAGPYPNAGWTVTGSGITGTVTVTGFVSSSQYTLSTSVTVAAGTTVTFTPPSLALQNLRLTTAIAVNFKAGTKVIAYYE